MFSDKLRLVQRSVRQSMFNQTRRRTFDFDQIDVLETRALLTFNGFGAYTEYDANGGPTTFVEVGDFNEDGHKDIVTPSLKDSNSAAANTTITVLYGNGAGALSVNPNQTYLSLASIGQFGLSDLRVADINTDGNDDVLVAYGPGLRAFLGSGNGTFSNPLTLVDLNASAQMFVLEDWNKDGHLDIAAGSPEPGEVNYDFTKLRVWLNNGNASGFTSTAILTVDNDTTSTMLAAGDMNGDGNSDLVWKDGASHVRIFPGNGNGTFGSSQLVAMEGIAVIRLRDVNQDSKLDLVSPSPFETGIRIRLNDGSGSFAASTLINMNGVSADVEFADIDNDGYGDLVSANPTNKSMSVAVGTGPGTFASVVSFSTGPDVAKTLPLDIKLVDLNEDGFLDSVLGNARGVDGDSSNTISVVLANAGASISGTVFHDVNNDGGLNIYDPNFGIREPGLASVQIHLDFNRDGVANGNDRILTTQASGQFTLTGLPAGTYLIRFYNPDNSWTATTDASVDVTVAENEVRTGINAGYVANVLPDLRLIDAALTENTIDLGAGNEIRVSTTVRNEGAKVVPLVSNTFYLSRDAVLQTNSDLDVGFIAWLGNVAPDSNYDFSENVWHLPSQNASYWNQDGTYYIAVRVDSPGWVLESDESNNENLGPGIDIIPFYALNTRGYSPQIRNAAIAQTYTENAPPVLFFDGSTLDDTDTSVLNGGRLTTRINNAANGDVLRIVSQGTGSGQVGLTGNAVTYGGIVVGTVAFDGNELTIDFNNLASRSVVEAIVGRIGFSSSSDNISTSQRSLTTRISDGSGGISMPVHQTIDITAVNDPPLLVNSSTVFYRENDPAIIINSGINVSDFDNITLSSATITIGNLVPNQDELSFTAVPETMGNISMSTNNSGLMTLVSEGATASLAQWQSALRSIRYSNSSNTPSTNPRTVEFRVNDGMANSTILRSTINVVLAADTPTVTSTTTLVNTQSTSGLKILRNASDGVEVSHFRISQIVNGRLFQNDGTTPIDNGDFISSVQAEAGLKFTPSTNSIATGRFYVQASTSNNLNGLGGGIVMATIAVTPAPIGTNGDDLFVVTYRSEAPADVIAISVSTNGGPKSLLGTFPLGSPVTINGLGGFDSVRIVGTSGDDVITINGNTSLTINDARLILASIEGRTLAGAAGGDTYRFDADTKLGLWTLDETGGGSDTINLSLTAAGLSLNLGIAGTQTVHAANLSLILGSAVNFENAVGGSGADSLIGNSLNNSLSGLAGNDTITGAGGSDVMFGGLANDTYNFGVASSLEDDQVHEKAGEGLDTLNFSAMTTSLVVSLGTSNVQNVHNNRRLKLSSSTTFENLTGGAGADTLVGNSVANRLIGGNGHNILVGSDGSDILEAGTGRDVLIGGRGLDTLSGGSGDDILIAGRTTNDTNAVNLNTLRTAWISATPYATRITNLRAGVGSPLVSLKAKVNVLNDAGEDDVLTGGANSDWYFRAVDDVITDLFAGEIVEVL